MAKPEDTPTTTTTNATAGVATDEQNAALEHTQGGATTRDDPTDMGVPMAPSTGNDRPGPEDALGTEPTRGDYSDRIGSTGYHPHEVVPDPAAKPGEPKVRVEAQRERAETPSD